ncbi:hypothetical protein EVAR_93099_1 [Eumeta japonica]|uniref:Uncharacterized protein n=1 Tax=Eumeta variegata TaxID=151549 RepID=A0A4C1TF50_EUMVA|nr:hypothetical protein EVAR_93099_1 [Eumeta japonica]
MTHQIGQVNPNKKKLVKCELESRIEGELSMEIPLYSHLYLVIATPPEHGTQNHGLRETKKKKKREERMLHSSRIPDDT